MHSNHKEKKKYGMIFTIDLLNGHGRPKKSSPESIVVSTIIISVPFIIAIIMLGHYLHSNTLISIQKKKLANYQEQIGEMAQVIEQQKTLEKNKHQITNGISDVSSLVNRHMQWSSVLETLVNNMPESMILTKLEAKQKFLTIKLLQKNSSQKTTNISVPTSTLQLNICGTSKAKCDPAVKQFRKRLNNSEQLKSKLDQIMVSQKSDTSENKNVVSYGIDCIFKPQL